MNMALYTKTNFKLTIFLFIELCELVYGQYNPYGYPPPNQQNPYNVYGPYLPQIPSPGDKDYRTYVYKGRRYGQQNNYYYGNGRPGDPRIQGQDEHFIYDRVSN